MEGLGLEEKRRACGVFWRGSGERQERERERRTHACTADGLVVVVVAVMP